MYDAHKLKLARLTLGWNVATLAKKANVNVYTIYRYERDNSAPMAETVAKLASAMGKEPKDFILDEILKGA